MEAELGVEWLEVETLDEAHDKVLELANDPTLANWNPNEQLYNALKDFYDANYEKHFKVVPFSEEEIYKQEIIIEMMLCLKNKWTLNIDSQHSNENWIIKASKLYNNLQVIIVETKEKLIQKMKDRIGYITNNEINITWRIYPNPTKDGKLNVLCVSLPNKDDAANPRTEIGLVETYWTASGEVRIRQFNTSPSWWWITVVPSEYWLKITPSISSIKQREQDFNYESKSNEAVKKKLESGIIKVYDSSWKQIQVSGFKDASRNNQIVPGENQRFANTQIDIGNQAPWRYTINLLVWTINKTFKVIKE
jgi:hypothetical protein